MCSLCEKKWDVMTIILWIYHQVEKMRIKLLCMHLHFFILPLCAPKNIYFWSALTNPPTFFVSGRLKTFFIVIIHHLRHKKTDTFSRMSPLCCQRNTDGNGEKKSVWCGLAVLFSKACAFYGALNIFLNAEMRAISIRKQFVTAP